MAIAVVQPGSFAGTWRDLDTGVDPYFYSMYPEYADGALDDPGIPDEPIYTRLEGPWGLPWHEGLEDPLAATGLDSTPNPTIFDGNHDFGAVAIVGAYEGAYRTYGPVQRWSHEPSGGLSGDQAVGRTMRFPANPPERYDTHGVRATDWRDFLTQGVEANEIPYMSDDEVNDSVLYWSGEWDL